MTLRNWNVCAAALKSGDIGVAESYIAGDWTTPHLTDLMTLFIANRQDIEAVVYGSWAGRLWYRVKHLLNRNTRSNSQKNIHAHYDLGNAFYSLWLDPSMNYSSAWFDGRPEQPLQAAQDAKVRRALEMVQAKPGDRILEIGCGWGALAEMATASFGASLTGVTLSTEQLAFAQARMRSLGIRRAAARAHVPICGCRTTGISECKPVTGTAPDAPSTPSAPSKWSKPWAANTGPRISSRCTGCSSPAAAPAFRAS
jgi:cyclopropane-fatty-acyl-phospholipid synthase